VSTEESAEDARSVVDLVCVNTEDGAAYARSVVDLAEIMKESRESLAEMQKSHEKAAVELAKTAAELSIKAVQAVSASNAKISPACHSQLWCEWTNTFTFRCICFSRGYKKWYKYAILNAIRAFIVRILRDPTGSASDFQASLNEDERKALYVCINEKIPRALLRTIWDTNDLDGAGLLHAPLQHAINPADMSLTIKRATKYYVVWI